MSNIGYAVFGSPRGIAVESNGIFKNLNLDRALYLNSSHIVLDKGEQVLMIRRIPSNLNNLERKDALLVVLYENALQHGENRAGGFVGSAICFKGKMPNAEKMITGLLYLFSKMKANIDEDNRFKAIDSSNWNISLPDANREFGMFEESKLVYSPLSSSTKNYVIKLNNLEKEAVALLSNFALNNSFHSVDYLYASTSNSVVKKMTATGFVEVAFSELFNYEKHLGYYKTRQIKDIEKLEFIKNNAADLQKKIALDDNEVKRLETNITSRSNELNRIEREITEAKKYLEDLSNRKNEASRNSGFHRSISQVNNKILSSEDIKNYEGLRRSIAEASHVIKKYSNVKIEDSFSSSDKENKAYLDSYFKEMPERKSKALRRNLFLFVTLSVLFLTFLVLFIYKGHELETHIADIEQQKENAIKEENAKIETANKKAKELLGNLNRFKKGSSSANHKEFKKAADLLLENFLTDKYDKNSQEYKFIADHKWEFWEFDYENHALVNRLSPNSKPYFITLDYEIKQPLTPYLVWKGEDSIEELLEKYEREPNDIYQNLNKEVLEDADIIKSHFKWVIEKENGKLQDLKSGEKIKLPFFKENK